MTNNQAVFIGSCIIIGLGSIGFSLGCMAKESKSIIGGGPVGIGLILFGLVYFFYSIFWMKIEEGKKKNNKENAPNSPTVDSEI